MSDPTKKEDSKDPVAELVNRLEEGKRATEKLDELEEQILDRIEQMVSQGASDADVSDIYVNDSGSVNPGQNNNTPDTPQD